MVEWLSKMKFWLKGHLIGIIMCYNPLNDELLPGEYSDAKIRRNVLPIIQH